ncbi:hypothetical protein [Bifidobacterium sp.]|uniref:hypothetical protein n=1 Tax=Bifidobacterium sp. TaxID=41200 RepID=UPI0039EC9D05
MTTIIYQYVVIWVSGGLHGLAQSSGTKPITQAGTSYGNVCLAILLALSLFKIFHNRKSIIAIKPKRLMIYCLLLVFSLFYYHTTSVSALFIAAIIGLALQNEKAHNYLVIFGVLALIFFSIQIIGISTGIISDSVILRTTADNAIPRHTLGFGYPNRAFAFLLPAWLGIYCIRKTLPKAILLSACGLFFAYTYLITDTKTVLILAIALAISPITKMLLEKNKTLSKASTVLFPLLTFFSIGLALFAGKNWNSKLNQILSFRPGFWYKYVSGGFSLIGPSSSNKILFATGQNPLDNLYLSQLYRGGIVFYILICALFLFFSTQLVQSKNYTVMVIVINYLVYSLSESQFSLITVLFLPLMFATILNKAVIIDDNCMHNKLSRNEGKEFLNFNRFFSRKISRRLAPRKY